MLLVDNIFSKDELNTIKDSVLKSQPYIDTALGRLMTVHLKDALSSKTIDKLNNIVKSITNTYLKIGGVAYVEYNLLYGVPNLPPHFDGDSTDLIINVQLESNTQWDLGLDLETYRLNDNCALIFNPNEQIHWRVHKKFYDGEYVRMLFIRLSNPDNPSDYSHLRYSQDHAIFKDVKEFRDSLKGKN